LARHSGDAFLANAALGKARSQSMAQLVVCDAGIGRAFLSGSLIMLKSDVRKPYPAPHPDMRLWRLRPPFEARCISKARRYPMPKF
jgi:hypothetical protein